MISDRAINYYQAKEDACKIVYIKGLYFSDRLFEFSKEYLSDFDFITVNLHSYAGDQDVSIDSIAEKICDDLDQLKISKAVFVSLGVGCAIALKIAKKRSDLVQGNVMLGFSNKPVDKALRQAQIDILSFAEQKGFDAESRSFIVQTHIQ